MTKFLGREICTPYSLTRVQRQFVSRDLRGDENVVRSAAVRWEISFDLEPRFGDDGATARLIADRMNRGDGSWNITLPQILHGATIAQDLKVSTAAKVGDTSLYVKAKTGTTNVPYGMILVVESHPYIVTAGASSITSGAERTIKIQPGLRDALAVDDVIDITSGEITINVKYVPEERVTYRFTDGGLQRDTVTVRTT